MEILRMCENKIIDNQLVFCVTYFELKGLATFTLIIVELIDRESLHYLWNNVRVRYLSSHSTIAKLTASVHSIYRTTLTFYNKWHKSEYFANVHMVLIMMLCLTPRVNVGLTNGLRTLWQSAVVSTPNINASTSLEVNPCFVLKMQL